MVTAPTNSTETTFPAPQSLPAGGLDPDRFAVKEAWYPVQYIEHLDPTRPTPFTLLGDNIVIWWDKQENSWRAFADRCPHRLAPLSEGRVNEDGLLECPYHGWTFTGGGTCDRIPQQHEGGKAEQSPRACVPALPTQVRQGLLFVYPGQPANAPLTPIPVIEALEDNPDDWVCLNTFRDLPYDALTLLENVLDSSHIPYTHHNTVGDRANVAPLDLEVVESSKQGFKGFWSEGPRKGTLGSQETIFVAPNLMWHDLTSKQFGRTLTVVYVTPIAKGKCRLFARFPFKFSSALPKFFIQLTPQWYSHINQNAILEDDQIFLYGQERYLDALGGSEKYAKACYLPTSADRYVSEFRRWVNDYQADPFPGQSFEPPQPREQLLDRYHSHTEHCRSCSHALQNFQRLRLGLGWVIAIAGGSLPLVLGGLRSQSFIWGLSLTGLIWVASGLWFYLGRFERKFKEGRSLPPRNLPAPKSKRKN